MMETLHSVTSERTVAEEWDLAWKEELDWSGALMTKAAPRCYTVYLMESLWLLSLDNGHYDLAESNRPTI